MIFQNGIVIVQCGNGIEQRRQKVSLCISHLGVIVPDAIADTLNVHGGDFGEPILDISSSIFGIFANANCRAAIHGDLQHNFHKLVKLLSAVPLPHYIILNLRFDLFFQFLQKNQW